MYDYGSLHSSVTLCSKHLRYRCIVKLPTNDFTIRSKYIFFVIIILEITLHRSILIWLYVSFILMCVWNKCRAIRGDLCLSQTNFQYRSFSQVLTRPLEPTVIVNFSNNESPLWSLRLTVIQWRPVTLMFPRNIDLCGVNVIWKKKGVTRILIFMFRCFYNVDMWTLYLRFTLLCCNSFANTFISIKG